MNAFPFWTKSRILLSGMLAGALGLRIWGVPYGLPHFIYIDEYHYLPAALQMLKKFDWNPHYFQNPPLLTYVHAFAMAVYYGMGKLFGMFSSAADFGRHYAVNASPHFLMARGITVCFGTATCWILYRIGKKLFGRPVGLVSCALLAFSFLHIRESRLAINDVPCVFFLTVSFLLFLRLRPYAFLAGCFAGLAVSMKYNAGLLPVSALIWMAAEAVREKQKGMVKLALVYFSGALLAFCVTCPWVFLDPHFFIQDFLTQAGYAKKPWLGGSPESSYLQFFKVFLTGYGILPFCFAVLGIIGLRQAPRKLWLLGIFPLLYYGVMGFSRLFFARFALPLLPFLALFSAYGVVSFSERMGKSHLNKWMAGLTLLACLQGILFASREDYLSTRSDTRMLSRDWISQNIPAGSQIVLEGYSPNLKDFTKGGLIKGFQVEDVGGRLALKSLEEWRAQGVDYIVTSQTVRNRFLMEPEKYTRPIAFYHALDMQAERVFDSDSVCLGISYQLENWRKPYRQSVWNLFKKGCLGPRIRVYDIRDVFQENISA